MYCFLTFFFLYIRRYVTQNVLRFIIIGIRPKGFLER